MYDKYMLENTLTQDNKNVFNKNITALKLLMMYLFLFQIKKIIQMRINKKLYV